MSAQSSTASFWRRVQQLLDERRDPLGDFGVREYLDAHPELLEEYARLASHLRGLQNIAGQSAAERAAPATPARRGGAWLALAAGFALALLAFLPRRAGDEASSVGLVLPQFSRDGRVRSWSQSVTTHRHGRAHTQTEIEGRGVRTHIRVATSRPSPAAFASVKHVRSEAKELAPHTSSSD